jgi:hypothetical protein
MLGGETAQLGQECGVATECQLRFDPLLQCDQVQLLQPLCLCARELLVSELSVGRAVPKPKRAPQ